MLFIFLSLRLCDHLLNLLTIVSHSLLTTIIQQAVSFGKCLREKLVSLIFFFFDLTLAHYLTFDAFCKILDVHNACNLEYLTLSHKFLPIASINYETKGKNDIW